MTIFWLPTQSSNGIVNQSQADAQLHRFSDDDWCEIAPYEKKNGKKEDALWLNLNCDATVKGSGRHKEDVVYNSEYQTDVHRDVTTPVDKETSLSTLVIYFR